MRGRGCEGVRFPLVANRRRGADATKYGTVVGRMGDRFDPALLQPPPPAAVARPGFPVAAVIAVACVGVLFVALFVVVAVFTVRRFQHRSSHTDPNVPLTQQYQPENRLFTVHYPVDFAAKRIDEGTVVVSRRISLIDDEAVTVAAVWQPISDDVNEFSRVLEHAFRKSIEEKGGHVSGGDPRPAKCPTSGALHDGIEIIDMYRIAGSESVTRWSCTFLAHGHGYKLTYAVGHDRIVEQRPLLERIIAATELSL
jgi:hypothetical protein